MTPLNRQTGVYFDMYDFFDFSNEMLCVANQQGYFVRVNPMWTDALGWSAEELTDRPYLDFVHPDDVKATALEASLLLNSDHETIHFENRYRCADGSYRWLAWRARFEPDSQQIIAAARDVTVERFQAAELREAVERFRLLAMQAPIGISQGDIEGQLFFVNPKLCEIAGAEPEEIKGFGWRHFIHPGDLDYMVETGRNDIAAGKTRISSNFRFIRKDGSVRWAASTSSLVLDARGTATGQISVTEDITERIAAETALRMKESQLRGIVDNAMAVIYLKDLEGRYIVANHHFRELFCKHGNDIIGMTALDCFPEAIARKFREADTEVFEKQSPLVFEEVALHDDGPHTYRSVKFPVTNEAGKIIGVGGISTDISDLKEAHEALKKNEELLRNLIEVQEKKQQTLCHDFHDGLIQYAIGSLMLLEGLRSKHSAEGTPEILDAVIDNLRKGVEDGRRAIRGIRPAVLDDSTMEAVLHDLVDQFPTSEFMVKLDCEPEIGRLPDSVQTTVYRVVQEALNNARKHSGTDVVRIELRQSDGDLHLEVRDFGCGFDVKSRTQGFGLLGMTERVRLLGGDCSIKSEKDAGTAIQIRLPITADE